MADCERKHCQKLADCGSKIRMFGSSSSTSSSAMFGGGAFSIIPGAMAARCSTDTGISQNHCHFKTTNLHNRQVVTTDTESHEELHSSSSCLHAAAAALQSTTDVCEKSGSHGNLASGLGAVSENEEVVSEGVKKGSSVADNSQSHIYTHSWDESDSVRNMMPANCDHSQAAVERDSKQSHSTDRMNITTAVNKQSHSTDRINITTGVNKHCNQPQDNTQPSLNKSKQSEKEKVIERWYCEKCGASLSTKYHLARHMRTHSEARPFQCSLCGKSYKDSSNLSLHMMNHVEETHPGILGRATSKRYKDTAKLAAGKRNEERKRKDDNSVLLSGSNCVGSVSTNYGNVGDSNAAAVLDSTASWIDHSSHWENGSGTTSHANFPLSHSQGRTPNVNFSSTKQTSNSEFSVTVQSSQMNLLSDCHSVPVRTSDVSFSTNLQTSDYSAYIQANAKFAANLQASASSNIQPSSINLLSKTQPVFGSLVSLAFVESTETENSFDYSGQDLFPGQPVKVFEQNLQTSFQAQNSTEQDNFLTQNSSLSSTQVQISTSAAGKKKKPKPANSYMCSVCNASFISKYHLDRHSRKHTGVKPFRCIQCDKAFSDTSNLTHHMIIHTGEKSFECEWCGHTFAYKASLKRHMHRHLFQARESNDVSGNSGADSVTTVASQTADQKVIFGPLRKKASTPKRYICDHCHADFATKYHLQRHLRKHSGDKPFQCLICHKAFNDKSNMERHKVGHLKDHTKKGKNKASKRPSERVNHKYMESVSDSDKQQETHLASAQSPDLRGGGREMMADASMMFSPSAEEMHDLHQTKSNGDLKHEDRSCWPSFAIKKTSSDLNEEDGAKHNPHKRTVNSKEERNNKQTNRDCESRAKRGANNGNIYRRNKHTLAFLRYYLRINTRATHNREARKGLKLKIVHGDTQPKQFEGLGKRGPKEKSTSDEIQPRQPREISQKHQQQNTKHHERHSSAKSPIHRERAVEHVADQSTPNARRKRLKSQIKSDHPHPSADVNFTKADTKNAKVKLAGEKKGNSLQNSFPEADNEDLPLNVRCRTDVNVSVTIKSEPHCEEMVLQQLNPFAQEHNDETDMGDESCEEEDSDGNLRLDVEDDGKEERDVRYDASNDEIKEDDDDGEATDVEGDNDDNDHNATTKMEDDSKHVSSRHAQNDNARSGRDDEDDDEDNDHTNTADVADDNDDDSAMVVTEIKYDNNGKRKALTAWSKSADDNIHREVEDARNAVDDIMIEPDFDCDSFWQDCDVFAKRRKERRTSAKSKLDRFICDICTARFSTKYLVKRHRRTHSDQKPFVCSECDKAFNDSSNLARHLHNIHKFSRSAAMEIIRTIKEKVEKSTSEEKDFWLTPKPRPKISSAKIRPKGKVRRRPKQDLRSKPTKETITSFPMMVNSSAVTLSGRLGSESAHLDGQESVTVSAVSPNNGGRCFHSSTKKPSTREKVCGDKIWTTGLNSKYETEEAGRQVNFNEDILKSVCSGSPTHHPHSTTNKPNARRKNSQGKRSMYLNPQYEKSEKATVGKNGLHEKGLNPAGLGHDEAAITMDTLTEDSVDTGWNKNNAALCKATELQDKMLTRFSTGLRNCVNSPKRQNKNDAAELTLQKGKMGRSTTVIKTTSKSEDSAVKKMNARTCQTCQSETPPSFAFESEKKRMKRKSKTHGSEGESLVESGSKKSEMKGKKKKRKCSTLGSPTSEMKLNEANVCKGGQRAEKATSVCHICSAAFATQAAMELHRQSHVGPKPFKCGVCDKAFNHCGNLLHHLHHIHKYSPHKAVTYLKTIRRRLLNETHTDALAQPKVDWEPPKTKMSSDYGHLLCRNSHSNEKTNMARNCSSNGYLRNKRGHHTHEKIESNDLTYDHLSYSVIGEYKYFSSGWVEGVHGSGFRQHSSKFGDGDERHNLSTHNVHEAQELCKFKQNPAQVTIKMEQTGDNFLQAEHDCYNDVCTITNCGHTDAGTVANHNNVDLDSDIGTMVNQDLEQRRNSEINPTMYSYNFVDETEKGEQALRKAAIYSQAQDNKDHKLHCRNDAPTEIDLQTIKTSDPQAVESLEGKLEQESRISEVGSNTTAFLLSAACPEACSSSPAVDSRSTAVESSLTAVWSSSVCQKESRVAKSPPTKKLTWLKANRQGKGGSDTLRQGGKLTKWAQQKANRQDKRDSRRLTKERELTKESSSSQSVVVGVQKQQQWIMPRPFECFICSSDFKDSNGLRQHLKIHSGSRPFLCTACGSSFPRNTELRRHMRTHTGERPFLCTYCGKSFADSSTLTQHVRLHTGYKPFKCPCCHLAFAQSSHMKDHWRRKHPSTAAK